MSALRSRAVSRDMPASRVGRLACLAGRELGRADALVRRLPTPKPWVVLGALVVADWAVMLEVARIAQHDGWLYFHGGDATWYYSSAWIVAHGHIPWGAISYGYSVLIAPIADFAGPNILHALPAIVVFNTVVLAPIALLCIYGIARMLGGRGFAYLASLAWVVFPVAVIHYFLPDYHSRYVDVTLPPALGLTARGDFPSLVFLLVAAYFAMRLIASAHGLDALGCGAAIGLAVAIKPSNALSIPAVGIAFVVARRWRGLVVAGAGMIPALIGLALWKYRGLGYLPAFSNKVGSYPPATIAYTSLAGIHLDPSRYLHIDWGQINHNLDGFRESTWSRRVIEWLTVGGLVGLARRSLPGAALIGVWLASFFIVKGSSPIVKFSWGSFLTHLIPAFPAFFLLASRRRSSSRSSDGGVSHRRSPPAAARRCRSGPRSTASAACRSCSRSSSSSCPRSPRPRRLTSTASTSTSRSTASASPCRPAREASPSRGSPSGRRASACRTRSSATTRARSAASGCATPRPSARSTRPARWLGFGRSNVLHRPIRRPGAGSTAWR